MSISFLGNNVHYLRHGECLQGQNALYFDMDITHQQDFNIQ